MFSKALKLKIKTWGRMFLFFGFMFFLIYTSFAGDFSETLVFKGFTGCILFFIIAVIVDKKFSFDAISKSLIVILLFFSVESTYAGNFSKNILFEILIFSGIVTSFIGILHWIGVKDLEVESEEEKIKVSQSRDIEINLPFNEVVNLCLEMIEKDNKLNLKGKNIDEGVIEATKGPSWKSWGEKVILKIEELDKNHTKVNINSKPWIPITMMDYGANLENVNRIRDYLVEHT